MKSSLLSLVLTLTLALFASVAVAQMTPYSIDHSYNNTNAHDSVLFDRAVQPVNLHVFGVLPNTTTTVVQRIHGDYTQTLATITVDGGIGTATLSNDVWVVPGDYIKVSGPTNATIEIQGLAW